MSVESPKKKETSIFQRILSLVTKNYVINLRIQTLIQINPHRLWRWSPEPVNMNFTAWATVLLCLSPGLRWCWRSSPASPRPRPKAPKACWEPFLPPSNWCWTPKGKYAAGMFLPIHLSREASGRGAYSHLSTTYLCFLFAECVDVVTAAVCVSWNIHHVPSVTSTECVRLWLHRSASHTCLMQQLCVTVGRAFISFSFKKLLKEAIFCSLFQVNLVPFGL